MTGLIDSFMNDRHDRDINDLRIQAHDARQRMLELEDQCAEMQHKLEKNTALTLALGMIMTQKLGISEDELSDFIRDATTRKEVPLKLKTVSDICVNCGRKVNPNFKKCIYCNHPVAGGAE